MNSSGDSQKHFPVMISEISEAFSVFKDEPALRYFDGTFGRGGHYRHLKALFPQMSAEVCDQDQAAIQFAHSEFSTLVQDKKLIIHHSNFAQIHTKLSGSFSMALLDLGVSSPQLDNADRGFSFYHDGPLDMRMDQTAETTAEELINTVSERDLIKIFAEYGEVQKPMRVIRAVMNDRTLKPFKKTSELAGLIERVDGWHQKGHHPATKYFMGLRIAVNQELAVIETAIPQLIEKLEDKGRLAVLTFHSLEDRIVKNLFRSSTVGFPVNKKVIIPTDEECEKNPRSRSAKLRVFQKGSQDDTRKKKRY